ncbi:hypothetical protein TKK_0004505 [Trichogramma kaykai]|uniref:C2 domain-containing protein n=1 Tax=Trichogramma kaykai TaxID=54128 RepID=A0ABD2XM62_9HYME
MSKSVELLANDDVEPGHGEMDKDNGLLDDSRRQLSRSATDLRSAERKSGSKSPLFFHLGRNRSRTATTTSSSGEGGHGHVVHKLHHHRHISVAQRTHSFFASLKSKWMASRAKERTGSKRGSKDPLAGDSPGTSSTSPHRQHHYHHHGHQDSDYAADYSSADHSRSSSATQSPARHLLNHPPESPLARSSPRNVGSVKKGSEDGSSTTTQQQQTGSSLATTTSTTAAATNAMSSSFFSSTAAALVSCTDGVVEAPPQQQQDDDNDAGTDKDEDTRRRELALRQHAFFQMRLHIRRGANLVAMDRSGFSDPYVKVKCNGRLLHKSRTVYRELNPVWDESVTLPIEDPFLPLNFKVFDYDWGLQDDFMGAAQLDLTKLELGQMQDFTLELKDPARPQRQLGEIFISATLWPKNQQEKEQYFQKSSRLADVNRRLKSQIWSSVVTIVLIQAKNLIPMDIDGTSDPYVKFRLGVEKYKSKVIAKTLNPMWLEQFDLHLYEEGQELEVTVWDRDKSRHQDDLMGRVVIDLAQLEREKTHSRWHELDDGAAGSIYLLLTISGTTASETISDLASHEETTQEKQLLLQKYSLGNTFQRFRDVGHLTVKVYRAQGLVAADLGGKSDPFCVLELVNSRLQTQTEYKTLTPNWQKIFTFNVKDINSVLEVTVYDEDRDHKVEFLGKVAIPLLRVKNGLKRWYALKDKKLRCRAKGNSPQILLEMNVVWNAVRASYRTLNPKEKKFMEPETKFKRQIFIRNVVRLKSVVMWFYDCGKYIQSCWEWEYKMRSSIALVLFVVGTYYFEPWMVPTLAFLIIFYYYLVTVFTGVPLSNQMSVHLHDSVDGNEDGPPTPGEDDEDDEDKDKEEKKSLRETFQAIQEVTQTVQNSMGYIASLCEKVKNLFNFTVPYLSCLVMLLTVCAAIILFLVPLRYLILLWGINKFTKKIIRPHSVPNNELLDLISRVPDDEELLNYRELRPSPTADGEGRDGAASPSSPTGSLSRRELRRRQQQQKQQQAQNQSQA